MRAEGGRAAAADGSQNSPKKTDAEGAVRAGRGGARERKLARENDEDRALH